VVARAYFGGDAMNFGLIRVKGSRRWHVAAPNKASSTPGSMPVLCEDLGIPRSVIEFSESGFEPKIGEDDE